ncbi:MAG: hypothetical protein HOK99_02735, partial [Betaproteobacteria bacterium]|nr:hypothetical protein [Betaproteobacteria bacterium]
DCFNKPVNGSSASGQLSVIAIGHAQYNGRRVIVCKGNGSFTAKGNNTKFNSLSYIDVLTGFTIYSEQTVVMGSEKMKIENTESSEIRI